MGSSHVITALLLFVSIRTRDSNKYFSELYKCRSHDFCICNSSLEKEKAIPSKKTQFSYRLGVAMLRTPHHRYVCYTNITCVYVLLATVNGRKVPVFPFCPACIISALARILLRLPIWAAACLSDIRREYVRHD